MGSRVAQLMQMLEEDETDSFLLFALAKEYEKLQDHAQAENYFRKLIELDNDYVGAYYHLGKLLEVRNQIDEARSIYSKGIEIAERDGHGKDLRELREALALC